MINIQRHDFSVAEEYLQLQKDSPSIGAIVTFSGLVREFYSGKNGNSKSDLFLEHYPVMTEKVLGNIIDQAKQRWGITQCRIVHRIGRLSLGEQIVFVGVNSPHRKEAFAACEFIMDFLKTDAPFWKKEISPEGETWVEAKKSDSAATKRWKEPDEEH